MATGEVEFGSYIEPFERQIEVNCLGTIRVTKAFCPLLRRCTKSSPRLVNVTSLAARVSLPGKFVFMINNNNHHKRATFLFYHLMLCYITCELMTNCSC